jgi:prenyltransferase beta subunit
LGECILETAYVDSILAIIFYGSVHNSGHFFDFLTKRILECLRRLWPESSETTLRRPFHRFILSSLMIRTIIRSLRNVLDSERLSDAAIRVRDSDLRGLPREDPGIDRSLAESIAWLGRAQDRSASKDGGVARDYSLIDGWNSSYPETTGYIIPTLLTYAELKGDEEARERAKRMLDWLVSIQFPDGGFQGSVVDATPVIPVTFNTGQILLGLASGTEEFGDEYREPMRRAANWLVATQDDDGCWRSHRSPFTEPTDKAYETHVSWGLFEAARLEPESDYARAALANIRWALSLQNENGWFRDCCLSEADNPLTHTIGYVLRGVIEAFRFSGDEEYLRASVKTADALVGAIRADGALPGRLDANWNGTVEWTCLTGNVQIAACWFMLFKHTGETRYLDAAIAANRFVRRTLDLAGPLEIRGAVKGSFPVSGGYCSYEYPNWAAKFLIDSLLLEQSIPAEA